VSESELAVLAKFGRFQNIKSPGCHFVPCCTGVTVAGLVSLRVKQLEVSSEVKTRDNVFVTLRVAVQFQVIETEAYKAFFKLSDPARQITAYVCDVVRSAVPKLTLDEVFEQKEELAHAVKSELSKTMEALGYRIKETLVTDIDPDPHVKSAMNEINAAQRLRMAAVEKAEAEKILAVKSAEAQAESKYLSGVGIARQRKAISDGLRDSVLSFTDHVHGATSREVMDLVLVTQYFDTLKDLGEHSRGSTIFIPHSPGSVTDVAAQIKHGLHSGASTMALTSAAPAPVVPQ
jgi:regulator of protease activity HflC (stomatin/prohibitin superfamily)